MEGSIFRRFFSPRHRSSLWEEAIASTYPYWGVASALVTLLLALLDARLFVGRQTISSWGKDFKEYPLSFANKTSIFAEGILPI